MSRKPPNAWRAIPDSSAASDMIRSLLRAIRVSEPMLRKVYGAVVDDQSASTSLGYALHNLTTAASRVEQSLTYLARTEKQRGMFAGMDCLPGQQDLFETDGEDNDR